MKSTRRTWTETSLPERLQHFFERSAARFPDNVALVCENERLTYRELDARANQLARRLSQAGVGPGARVGLFLDRSVWTYVAILGALKAGAAYVPLDLAFPSERILRIAEDAALVLVLTVEACLPRLGPVAARALALDREAAVIALQPTARLDIQSAPEGDRALCYVIYTSGSSGRPKGVAIEHRSVCNFVNVAARLYGVVETDRVYQGLSVAFDFSIEEIWPAFLAGATLIAGPNGPARLGPELARFLNEQRVTVLCCVPTLLATLDQDLPLLRLLNVGGEACPQELVARWHRPGRRLLNTYGPTETTVTATCAELAPDRMVTIGAPLPTYEVLIVDEDLRPTPAGQIGEILIGGLGVARGYLNSEDLNRQVFVSDGAGGRRYRTGDLGRLTPDGEIEFLGRKDTQLKIRGYRVNLAEIESAMLDDPDVLQAVAAPYGPPGQEQKLVGYVVPRNGQFHAHERARQLVEDLRRKLPEYMAPRDILVMDAFPLLPSGKVDRGRLPAPDLCDAQRPHTPPDGPTESALAAIWAEIFGCARVSVEEDFFTDLGGNSLAAAHAVSTMRRQPCFARLSIADIYHFPTVRSLAQRAAALERAPYHDAQQRQAAAVSDLRFAACGAAQAASLYALTAFLAAPALAALYLAQRAGWLDAAGLLLALPAMSLGFLLIILLLPLAGKWLLLGRIKAGRYPLWGWFYLRWWLVGKIVALSPIGGLTGGPLLPIYARLLGARIGPNCYLGSANMLAFDLLDIGEGSSIGYDTHLLGAKVEEGALVLGPIRIGRDCFVGSNSVLLPHATIEDGGRLGDQSLLHSGATIPAGQGWSGSPARPELDSGLAALAALAPLDTSSPVRVSGYVLGLIALALLTALAATPSAWILLRAHAALDGWAFLLATPLAGLAFVACFCLAVVMAKKILSPHVTAGVYPLDSNFYLRKWFVDKCLEASLLYTHSLYGTLYLAPFLRALGVRIGKRVEVSTASRITVDLLDIRDESFVADAAVVGPARVYRGRILIAPTRVGARAFVGNVALLPAGRELPDGSLLGVLSVPPARDMAQGSNWVGSPAIFLPRRQQSDAFPLEQTFAPTPGSYARRLGYEYVRTTFPAALLFATAGATAKSCALLIAASGPTLAFALAPAVYYSATLLAVGLVALLKQRIIGAYVPQQKPLWSSFVRRSELVTGLYESFVVPAFLNLLTGTPFAAMILRCFGARIGRRVFLNSTFMTEFDLVRVEDDAVVEANASLQTHLFEDRVMKMSNLRIGRGCSIGLRGVVLYDAVMHEGAQLDALSLLMKGEVLLPFTRWRGAPAARCD